jgi:hypothetical protein
MIYIHLLTLVGFGLIGYVPNTLYYVLIQLVVHFKGRPGLVVSGTDYETRGPGSYPGSQ